MQYHKQLFRHDPDNGQYGDCFRTALACILDRTPESVPHFLEGGPSGEEFEKRFRVWLLGQGYAWLAVAWDNLDGMYATMKVQNPGVLYLLAGTSPRGVCHQVVACEDRIIHDPHVDGGGLVGPSADGYYWVSFLLPRAVHLPEGPHVGDIS